MPRTVPASDRVRGGPAGVRVGPCTARVAGRSRLIARDHLGAVDERQRIFAAAEPGESRGELPVGIRRLEAAVRGGSGRCRGRRAPSRRRHGHGHGALRRRLRGGAAVPTRQLGRQRFCAHEQQRPDGDQSRANAMSCGRLGRKRCDHGRRLTAGQSVPKCSDQLAAAPVALLGLLRERPLEHGIDLPREAGAQARCGRDGRAHVSRSLGGDGLPTKRTLARQELERDDPERIPVGGRTRRLPLGLLRREIAAGAEHGPRPGHRRDSECRGDPEVGDVHPSLLVQQQVRGLHVAVDDAARVRVIERARRFVEPAKCECRRLRAARADHLVERAAGEILHDDERTIPPDADVVDRDRVRFAGEPRRGARLPLEAVTEVRVVGPSVVEQLDGDGAAELRIRRLVDLAHAATCNPHRPPVAGREQAGADPRAVEPRCHIRIAVVRNAAPRSRHHLETSPLLKTPKRDMSVSRRVRPL